MKTKETLEEATNSTEGNIIQFLVGSHSYEGVWFGNNHPYRDGNFWWRSILNECKAKKMYSEEEVLDILFTMSVDNPNDITKWFEQFKKQIRYDARKN